jgi:hypothetical protein
MRVVIRQSSEVATCRPGKPAAWEEASAGSADLRRGK